MIDENGNIVDWAGSRDLPNCDKIVNWINKL